METYCALRLKEQLFPLKIVPQNAPRIKTQYMKNLPIQLKIAAATSALETLTSAVVTCYFLYGLISGQEKSLQMILGIIVLMIAATAFLASATFNLIKGKRWARSGIVFWQILQISIGWGSLGGQNEIIPIALAIFISSAITISMLFTKPVNKLFEEKD